MHDAFIGLVGTYNPIACPVSGSALGVATDYVYMTDWSYVFNCVMLCIAFYSIFRLIGLVFGGGKRNV